MQFTAVEPLDLFQRCKHDKRNKKNTSTVLEEHQKCQILKPGKIKTKLFSSSDTSPVKWDSEYGQRDALKPPSFNCSSTSCASISLRHVSTEAVTADHRGGFTLRDQASLCGGAWNAADPSSSPERLKALCVCVKAACSCTWQSYSTESKTVAKFCGVGTRVNNHMLNLLVSTKELWNRSLCLLHYLLTRSLWAQSSSGNYYQVLYTGKVGSDDLNYHFYSNNGSAA